MLVLVLDLESMQSWTGVAVQQGCWVGGRMRKFAAIDALVGKPSRVGPAIGRSALDFSRRGRRSVVGAARPERAVRRGCRQSGETASPSKFRRPGRIAGDGRSVAGESGGVFMNVSGVLDSYGLRRPSVAIATEMTASAGPAMESGG